MANYYLRIKGFTPSTLPLSRVGEYLSALADLVGKDSRVYFDRVIKGSATLKIRSLDENPRELETRVRFSPTAKKGSDIRRGYDKLSKLLEEDKVSADFRPEKGAVIIDFPGIKRSSEAFPIIKEYGEINGRIIRMGGKDETVPVGLLTPDGETVNCTANMDMVRRLKTYLLEPVDVILSGIGRWERSDSGKWEIKEFIISDASVFETGGFDEVLFAVREKGSGWDSEDDPEAALYRLRHGE